MSRQTPEATKRLFQANLGLGVATLFAPALSANGVTKLKSMLISNVSLTGLVKLTLYYVPSGQVATNTTKILNAADVPIGQAILWEAEGDHLLLFHAGDTLQGFCDSANNVNIFGFGTDIQ